MDMDTLYSFTKLVLDSQPARYDSSVYPIPWRWPPISGTWRIGIVPEDPVFPLHPPVKRAMEEAIRILEVRGHKIVRLKRTECQIMALNEVANNIFTIDRGAIKHLEASGEPFVPAVLNITQQAEKLKRHHTSSLPDTTDLDRLGKLAVLNTRRAELRDLWRKTWFDNNLDICLAPPAQSTAVQHDQFGLAPYTTFLNCLDVSPFACLPVLYLLTVTVSGVCYPIRTRCTVR